MTENPVVTRYLATLDAGLAGLHAEDRAEVLRDIRSHIAEATSSGKDLDAVLGALGSADALARAYSVELLISKPAAFRNRSNRFLRLAGLIVVGSIPTLLAVAVFGAVGLAFVAAGIALFVAGQLALADNLPSWITLTADPRLAVVLGPIFFLVGGMLLAGLWGYVHVAAKVVRRVLPPKAA